MVLWSLRELGCPSTCAEGVQGSQGYHEIGVPQDTEDMWGSPFLKGLGYPPCTRESLAPCPPSLRDWGSPPVPESCGDPRARPVLYGNCSVSPKQRWGPYPHVQSHLGVRCVGSPCLSSMGLEVPQGLRVHRITHPYTPMELRSP